jgi:hypothetical protein
MIVVMRFMIPNLLYPDIVMPVTVKIVRRSINTTNPLVIHIKVIGIVDASRGKINQDAIFSGLGPVVHQIDQSFF